MSKARIIVQFKRLKKSSNLGCYSVLLKLNISNCSRHIYASMVWNMDPVLAVRLGYFRSSGDNPAKK